MYMKLAKKTVSMMEAKEGYIHQHLLQYIKVLNNLIVTLGENNQFDDFNFSLEKMSTLMTTTLLPEGENAIHDQNEGDYPKILSASSFT